MKADEVMIRNVLTVGPETPLSAAVALMVDKRVSGIPVVSDGNKLVGILTEGDLLHRIENGTGQKLRSRWLEFLVGPGRSARQYVAEHSRLVSDLMTKDVATVTEGTPLEEVVQLMEQRHIRRVPVVRLDQLVGIISRLDLVRALGRKLAELPRTASTDAAIETSVRAELKPQPWIVASNINIGVKDGIVTLAGIIYDDRCRDGLRVAAQNVPGVKDVDDQLVWVDPRSGYAFPIA